MCISDTMGKHHKCICRKECVKFRKKMLPTIFLPRRVTYTTVTLIDNIYISKILNDIRSDVILNDMSDHYPCIALVNLGKKLPTKLNKTV